ncbi:hypothetical protein [Gramella sp. KN1008]|uniref:hypothetical protein n=1 Tax=Gramella sp. KN1008 TaxID=2529298 RepID=UPI00103F57F9|nr:hypothetical protein [Gramella sp. KN1008]TBW26813.1 hypothetical protein EZJ28_13300 [Gramella sp. KN1008]
MWDYIIEHSLYLTYIFELLAATAGVFYLVKRKKLEFAEKLLVAYLIFIFVFDLFGISFYLYGGFYDFKHVEFVKGTVFENNSWLYNSLAIITSSIYTLYFALQLRSARIKRSLFYLIGLFVVTGIMSFFISDNFFETTSSYVYIFGALMISLSIGVYYIELIKTDRILEFKKELAIFISIGLLVYKLSITPLFIFTKYTQVSDEFFLIFTWSIKIANIFMYSIFTYGFIRSTYRVSTKSYNLPT